MLLTEVTTTIFKYLLHSVDLQHEQRWQNKDIYISYLELFMGKGPLVGVVPLDQQPLRLLLSSGFIKLAVYVLFFVIVMNFYGIPLHIIRDLFMTFQQFMKDIYDFQRVRAATRYMDRLPDVTREELATINDRCCLICRDDMEHAKRCCGGKKRKRGRRRR